LAGGGEESDEALMSRVQRGDRGAFHLLVERHARGVLQHVARVVRDRASAEDLAQEAFVRLWTRSDSYRSESRVAAWLHAIARNACLDFLKRRRREPALEEASDLADRSSGPAGRLERDELAARVRAAVASLPDPFREPFELCVLQGLSYEDAARVLGCSVKTLSSRLARARERVRTELRPYLTSGQEARP
jgi:RNA polymerase sigma-70 factor (ECF subfamily)